MNKEYLNCIENLNNDNVDIRLNSLRKLKEGIEKGEIERPVRGEEVIFFFKQKTAYEMIW